ncbi:hypothetical protein GCM10028808_23800 [Spirosoma migulaei]
MNPMNLSSINSIKPYHDAGLNKLYGLLFCDSTDLYKSATQPTGYPWDTLLAENPDLGTVQAISVDETLETRPQILAYNLLLAKGFPVHAKELLGVIIEVAVGDGLDVLAAFKDGTCRYINHTEKLLVWDTQTDKSNQLVSQLFASSMTVVHRIGLWDQGRTSFPTAGMIKLTFLVSDGLYFGLGPFDALQRDPMAGPVIQSAVQLMTYLVDQAI